MDYLNNNLIIAHYCGFNIMKPLPSYWTFDRFIRNLDNALLKKLMQSQVLKLSKMGIIDTSFIALDSTPISANTKQNNPKSFAKNKFAKNNQPKSDMDCGLGVHAITRIGTMAKKTRGCTKYVTLLDDYRLSIDRECVSFKKIYALRTEAERYNSRFKQTGQERLWVHSFNAAQNLNSVAHIALLAVAHAAVVTKFESSYRSLKSVKRIA